MSVLKQMRPVPRADVMAIDAYVPGKSSAPGVGKVHKLPRTRRRSARRPWRSRRSGRQRTCLPFIPTAPPRDCAKRSAAAMGWMRRISSAAMAPTIFWACWPTPICSRGMRASTRNTVFLNTQS